MEEKLLKNPIKVLTLRKTWEVNPDGTIRKETVLYTAFGIDDDGLFDADVTLSGIKRK